MDCNEVNAKFYAAQLNLTAWITSVMSLVPPPPPPPPPPEDVSVADYLKLVEQWEQEGLLPVLEEACSG